MDSPIAPLRIETLLEHREWVRRVARVLVADESAADDLEQDLWAKAIEKPPRIHGSVRGWLAAALRNAFLNRRRADARRECREQAASRPEGQPPTADVVALAEAHRVVVAAVLELEEPYRRTVLLRFFSDLSPAEIAEREGAPVETVRTRLKRACAMLRERLDAKEGGNRRAWQVALLPLSAAAPTAVAGSGGVSIAGGLLMQTSVKIAAAAVLVGALGFTTYLVWGSSKPEARPAPSEAAGAEADSAARGDGEPGALAGGPTLARGEGTAGASVSGRSRVGTASGSGAAGSDPASGPSGGASAGMAGSAAGPGAATGPGAGALGVTPGKPGPAGEVSGRLLLMADKTPVSGASVSIVSNDLPAGTRPPEVSKATTGFDGAFRLSSLPPATWWLVASKEGFASQTFSAKVLEGNGESEIEILLAAAGSIEGRVTDARGDPAAGLAVKCEPSTGLSGRPAAPPTATDGEGGYRFPALAAGDYVVVLERAKGQSQRAGASVVEGKATRLDFAGGAVLRGTLSDEARAPIVGARVRALAVEGGYASREATTDKAGRFRIDEIQPGEWRIHVQVFGKQGFSAEVARVVVFPGENELTVDLTRTDLAGEVVGRVLSGATAGPLASSQVQLTLTLLEANGGAWTLGRSFQMAFADAEGRFRFRALKPGRYRFAAVPLDGGLRLHDEDFDLAAGEKKDLRDVTLEAMKVGKVRFVVKDEAGAPVLNAAFSTRRGRDVWTFNPGNPEPGTYTTQLEVGTPVVSVSRAGLVGADVTVEVLEGETATVDVTLHAAPPPK